MQARGFQARFAAEGMHAPCAEDLRRLRLVGCRAAQGLGKGGHALALLLERREDLVFTGDVGTGKTHMASALSRLARGRCLEARLFVIDELGFLPLDSGGARLAFQAFADCV